MGAADSQIMLPVMSGGGKVGTPGCLLLVSTRSHLLIG